LAAFAFLVEIINFVVNRYFLSPPESNEEKRLTLEAKRLRQECKKLEGSPATFLEFAKIGREATTYERRVETLKTEREARKNTQAGKFASQITYFMFPIPLLFSYFFWSLFVSDTEPVMIVPNPSWIWPMAHMIALPNQPPNGAVSSVGWMFLCRRVFARLIELAMPA